MTIQFIETITGLYDRNEWDRGPWDSEEFDKLVWVDPDTGLKCGLVRNSYGAWCGYVGISKDHPLHGVEYDRLYMDINVHGALTYSCLDEEGIWWLGFDCNHTCDMAPQRDIFGYPKSGEYRTQGYALEETTQLAKQIANIKEWDDYYGDKDEDSEY